MSKFFASAADARKKRQAALKSAMDSHDPPISAKDFASTTKRDVKQIHNFRGGGATLTVEQAKEFAPHLGCEPMDLLVKYTKREANAQSNGEASGGGDKKSATIVTVDAEAAQSSRKQALDAWMNGLEIGATAVAETLEGSGASKELSMSIAQSRNGAELLSYDLARRIEGAYDLAPGTIAGSPTEEEVGTLEEDERSHLTASTSDAPKKPTRRTSKKKKTKKTTKATKKRGGGRGKIAVTGIPNSVQVTTEELVDLLPSVIVIEEREGKYYVRSAVLS